MNKSILSYSVSEYVNYLFGLVIYIQPGIF
jgi:hypothetical protein